MGGLLGALVWLWLRTLRLRVVVADDAAFIGDRPLVLAFWHGQQLGLLASRRWLRRRRSGRPLAVLVSHSKDGQLQSGAMRVLGQTVVRGSSSRGAVAGQRALVAAARAGADLGFAADGPRGPLQRAKAGASHAAAKADGVLLPAASACRRPWVLRRAWDRFEIPRPFSRVVVVFGAPIRARRADLGAAIDGARARACLELGLPVAVGCPVDSPAG